MKKGNVLLDKSFLMAVATTRLCKILIQEQREYVLGKQLLRSGTAVGALIREANNAESRADFIHKLGIAQKECDETIYWTELLKETGCTLDIQHINQQATELLKIIRSSILTAKENLQNRKNDTAKKKM